MQRKKILIFIDWFLPGYKAGGPIQSVANLVDHLDSEYEFSIVTRDRDYCEDTPYPGIVPNEWTSLDYGVRVMYISKDKLFRKTIKKIIQNEDFDVVYLNSLYSLYFTLIPLYYLKKIFSLRLDIKSSARKVIVAPRGMLSEGALSVKATKKKFFLSSTRIIGLFSNVIFHATSSQEVNDIRLKFGHRAKVRFAPNLPGKAKPEEIKPVKKEKGKLKVVNIARVAPEKGLLYALEVLRNVRSKIEFDIYGPVYDEKYWELCKEIIKLLPSNIKVEYKGSLPSEKIHQTISGYHLMLMPTKGENFGHIIIESFSAGRPVIISDKTPWHNLKDVKAGWNIPLTDPAKYAEAIEMFAEMSQDDFDHWHQGALSLSIRILEDEEAIRMNRALFE